MNGVDVRTEGHTEVKSFETQAVSAIRCPRFRQGRDMPAIIAPMEQQTAQRFEAWLAERGIEGERRRVRESPEGILVSKFAPGFARRNSRSG